MASLSGPNGFDRFNKKGVRKGVPNNLLAGVRFLASWHSVGLPDANFLHSGWGQVKMQFFRLFGARVGRPVAPRITGVRAGPAFETASGVGYRTLVR